MKTNLACALVSLLGLVATNAEHADKPTRAPERIELHDQFGAPQRLSFPATNVVVLVVADRKGSEQVNGWVNALNFRYTNQIDVRGLADVRGVPSLLRDSVRRSLRETFAYPVMLDWNGDKASAFGRPQNQAVVLVIAPRGEVLVRVSGPACSEALKKVCAAINSLIATPDGEGHKSILRPATNHQP